MADSSEFNSKNMTSFDGISNMEPSQDNNSINNNNIGMESMDFADSENSIDFSKSETEPNMPIIKLKHNNRKFIPFYQLNLVEILIGLKNTWFGILDDILEGNIKLNILSKKNRLFYVGLTILIIAIILYIYDYMIKNNDSNSLNNILGNLDTGRNNIVEIRHIYEKRD